VRCLLLLLALPLLYLQALLQGSCHSQLGG
jgi:hypothetical protein